MTWIKAGTPYNPSAAQGGVKTLTVPTGITAADTMLIVVTGSTDAPTSLAVTPSAGTLTTLVPITVLNNSFTAIYTVKGIAAGGTVTVTSTGQDGIVITHDYYSGSVTAGTAAMWNRGGVTGATSTANPTTTTAGQRVVLVATERTNPVTTTPSFTNTSGFTPVTRSFTESPAPGVVSSVTVADFVASSTTSGTTTITYNASSGNAGAIHLLETVAAPPAPVIRTSWLGSMETNAVRAGWVVENAASIRAVVSTNSSLSSPVYSSAVTVPASGWATSRVTGLTPNTRYYVGIEIDGVLQSAGRVNGRTLSTAAKTYTVVTGSCQRNGSDPAIYDRMAADSPDFFVHQGDLHYADTSDVATWRSAFVTAMESSHFKAFRANVPMEYFYDNHDWAGQALVVEDDWDGRPVTPLTMVRELTGEWPLADTNCKSWQHGNVRHIHLDQWSGRDVRDTAGANFMTTAQEDWFYAELEAATEPLIVWYSGWPLYQNVAGGRWGSYPAQVNRIKAWLAARPSIRNRIIGVGGDSHNVIADTGANQAPFGPIPTLNASGFAAAGGMPSGTWDIGAMSNDSPERAYYSRLTLTDTGAIVRPKWEAVRDDGTVVMTWTADYPYRPAVSVWSGTAEVSATMTVWNGTAEVPATLEIA